MQCSDLDFYSDHFMTVEPNAASRDKPQKHFQFN